MIKLKRILIVLLSVIIIIIALFGLLIFLDDFQWPGGLFFDSSVGQAERIKIDRDVLPLIKKSLDQGFKVYVSQDKNCRIVHEICSNLSVKYVYNKYGDWEPGHIFLKDDLYKFESLI